MIQTVGNWMLIVSAVPAVLFVITYTLTTRWWRSRDGWHIMSFMAALAAVLTLAIIGSFWRPYWFQIMRLTVFTSIPVVIWWRYLILISAQILPRRKK